MNSIISVTLNKNLGQSLMSCRLMETDPSGKTTLKENVTVSSRFWIDSFFVIRSHQTGAFINKASMCFCTFMAVEILQGSSVPPRVLMNVPFNCSVCVLLCAACRPAGVTGAFTTYSCSSGCSYREFLHPGNPSPPSSLLSLQHSCCILNCVSGSCQVFFKPPSYSLYRPAGMKHSYP